MKIEKMGLKYLQKEIEDTKSFIDELQRTMENIPKGSALGRLSIIGTIKYESMRLNKMELELKRRMEQEKQMINEGGDNNV